MFSLFSGLNSKQMAELRAMFLITHAQLEKIQMTNDELKTGLTDATAKLQKIGNESSATLQKVKDLEAAIAAGDITDAGVLAAFADLKAAVQTVDDLVPDAE